MKHIFRLGVWMCALPVLESQSEIFPSRWNFMPTRKRERKVQTACNEIFNANFNVNLDQWWSAVLDWSIQCFKKDVETANRVCHSMSLKLPALQEFTVDGNDSRTAGHQKVWGRWRGGEKNKQHWGKARKVAYAFRSVQAHVPVGRRRRRARRSATPSSSTSTLCQLFYI